MRKAFCGAMAAAVGCGYLVSKSNVLRVYEYEVNSAKLPSEFDGFRIVHLSDLHGKRYGENDVELVRACEKLDPDMIAFTGDLFSRDRSMEDILSRLSLMKSLAELAPVYYIWGNHEGDTPKNAAAMNEHLFKLGVNVLMDRTQRLYRGGSYINISGLVLPPRFYRQADGSYRSLPKVRLRDINKRLGSAEKDSFELLLAHTPLPFKKYAEWGADLTLSGHIHGGMIRVCGIGLLSPERRFFPRYTKGLYRCGDSQMIVSAGLGKFRVNNPEMIALCVLKKIEQGE